MFFLLDTTGSAPGQKKNLMHQTLWFHPGVQSPGRGSIPMALQTVLWSHWKDFLAGNTNLLTPHSDLAALHNTSFLCMFQQPGQEEDSWEVQSYRSKALLWKGKEGAVPLMDICHTLLGASSQQNVAALVWFENACCALVLHLTQSPLLCLAWGKCVSHKIKTHRVHSNPLCIPVTSSSTSPATGEYSFLSCCRWGKWCVQRWNGRLIMCLPPAKGCAGSYIWAKRRICLPCCVSTHSSCPSLLWLLLPALLNLFISSFSFPPSSSSSPMYQYQLS